MIKPIFINIIENIEKIIENIEKNENLSLLSDVSSAYKLFRENGYDKDFESFEKELREFLNSKEIQELASKASDEVSGEVLKRVSGGAGMSRRALVGGIASLMAALSLSASASAANSLPVGAQQASTNSNVAHTNTNTTNANVAHTNNNVNNNNVSSQTMEQQIAQAVAQRQARLRSGVLNNANNAHTNNNNTNVNVTHTNTKTTNANVAHTNSNNTNVNVASARSNNANLTGTGTEKKLMQEKILTARQNLKKVKSRTENKDKSEEKIRHEKARALKQRMREAAKKKKNEEEEKNKIKKNEEKKDDKKE